MKKQLRLLFALIALFSFADATAQVNVDLKVRNQRIVGNAFYFDVYMERTGSNDLYLGNADFVFSFDHANFSSPTFNMQASSAVLESSNSTDVSASYEANTATEIGTGLSANRLIINVQPPAFNSGNFASTIARIDNSEATHFLGTFYVTGMTNIGTNPNLQWVTEGTGVRTKVYTINSSTLKSSLATVNDIDPAVGTEPTTQTTALTVYSYNHNSISLKWTNGNGSNRIVLAKETSAVESSLPTDGITYTADAAFEAGSQIGSTGVYVVYIGTDTLLTVTGLDPNTTYHFAALEFNGADGNSENYYQTGPAAVSETTLTAEPAVQASNLAFTSVSTSALGLIWNAGDGSDYIVVAKQGSAPSTTPTDGTGYTANTAFGSGDTLAAGEFLVYSGTDTTVNVTALSAQTEYYFAVYTFNGSSGTTNYLTTSPATNNRYTYSTDPTTAPSALVANNVGATTLDLNWVGGDGEYHIVVAKQGSATNTAPSDGTSYTANAAFSSGDTVAAGEYVLFAGADTTISVTGLSPATQYYFSVYTYNSDGSNTGTINYYPTASTTSATTITAEPTLAASALTFDDTSSSTLDLIWNAGNGSSYLVVVKQGSAPATTPDDAVAYTANSAFGSGDTLTTGEYVVYSGSDTSVSVTAISAQAAYYFRVYTYNGSGTSSNYLVSSYASGNAYTHATEPTTAPSSVITANIASTSMDVRWVAGNGGYSIVVAKEGSAPGAAPFDGIGYTANAAFSSGDELETGEYIVYAGTDTTVSITGLTASTTYHYAVYTYNYDGSNAPTTNYYPVAATISASTHSGEPTIASSNMTFTTQTTSTLALTWNKGDGTDRIIVAKAGSAPANTPDDGSTYSASATFGSGDSVAASEYVVYNGSDSSVTVTGLAQNTTYYFTVYEYSGTGSTTNYLTSSSLTGSENTYLSLDVTVMLEGPYNGSTMDTNLRNLGYIPTSQPYDDTAAWNYAGSESVSAIPAGVVDWVLVELRESSSGADNATTATIRQAGFLLRDGSIVSTDGTSTMTFDIISSGTYYVVVHHRTHIPVMSANAITFSSTDHVYDFTTGQTQVYKPSAMSDYSTFDLGSGVYGMISGSAENTVSEFSITAADRSDCWNDRNINGYHMTDVNLDGVVDASDRTLILDNVTRSSQLP